MDLADNASSRQLLHRLAEGDVAAFGEIFEGHYKLLCRFAIRYVGVGEVAEELVADVLTTLWQGRKTLRIHHSLEAYLYAAVKNACLNYLKSRIGRQRFEPDAAADAYPVAPATDLEYGELEKIVEAGIGQLPPACRTIFMLNRQAGMSYEEIAQSLGLSRKTVKAQMGIALKKLRGYLGRHWDKLPLLLLPFSR
jgi:RNA polymerase sigma-70 factor (ECF subfamily)